VRPRQVRYQAALRPDCLDYNNDFGAASPTSIVGNCGVALLSV
jgi:hypothetical protein